MPMKQHLLLLTELKLHTYIFQFFSSQELLAPFLEPQSCSKEVCRVGGGRTNASDHSRMWDTKELEEIVPALEMLAINI